MRSFVGKNEKKLVFPLKNSSSLYLKVELAEKRMSPSPSSLPKYMISFGVFGLLPHTSNARARSVVIQRFPNLSSLMAKARSPFRWKSRFLGSNWSFSLLYIKSPPLFEMAQSRPLQSSMQLSMSSMTRFPCVGLYCLYFMLPGLRGSPVARMMPSLSVAIHIVPFLSWVIWRTSQLLKS